MDTVGIVGLGVMGSNCAKKLMESGVPVAGYDPYPPAVKRASEAGVSMCGSPAELAGKGGVILMFVPPTRKRSCSARAGSHPGRPRAPWSST